MSLPTPWCYPSQQMGCCVSRDVSRAAILMMALHFSFGRCSVFYFILAPLLHVVRRPSQQGGLAPICRPDRRRATVTPT